jgi:hypothetical protein
MPDNETNTNEANNNQANNNEAKTPTPPSSPLRAAASRANGAKSRGPKTQQGREQCERASLRHGFLARSIVLPSENMEKFRQLVRDLEDEYRPATPNEIRIVEAMAAGTWRQRRTWSLEKSLLSYELRQQASAPEFCHEDQPTQTSLTVRQMTDTSGGLDYLNRCDMRFSRQLRSLQLRLQESRRERQREALAAQNQGAVA